MAITIRHDEIDTKALDKLKDHYKEHNKVGSYSKALLKAAHELPSLYAELKKTKLELQHLKGQFDDLIYLLQQRNQTTQDINEILYPKDKE